MVSSTVYMKGYIAKLYEECPIMQVRERIDISTNIMMFKIVNRVAPEYLSNCLPDENAQNYNLRNNNDIRLPQARLESYKRSFFPRAIKLWNNLSYHAKNSVGVAEFKIALHQNQIFPNVLYYYGERWASVHHARMRMGCSKLHSDLCLRLHVIDNP